MQNAHYFAHTGLQSDASDWQPLHEHLSSVAQLAGKKADVFGARECAHLVGLLHDLGKYSNDFQQRLQGSNKQADHATAGAKEVVQHLTRLFGEQAIPFAKLLAFCIAGHHAGLANGVDKGQNRSTLKQRLHKDIPVLDAIWQQEIQLPKTLDLPNLQPHKPSSKYTGFRFAFFTRMLFSCLIDADRIDTANYDRQINGHESLVNNYPGIAQLQTQLNDHLHTFSKNTKKTKLNGLRQHILAHVREQAIKPRTSGLYSLTVPTGGGKTLTSLAFALDHALKNQQRRVIYVIPFTSIIEQTAEVFREALGEHKDAVLEHHSSFDRDKLPVEIEGLPKLRQADYRDKLNLAMASWDAPIVVTTAVQFFESLFSDRPSKCRKLHNIAGSVIVLDEAQTLPLKLLRPVMAAIDELALNYNCSIVLCTATQPALKTGDFHNGLDMREIAPEPAELFEEFRRTKVKSLGEQSDVQLVQHLRDNEQVLMIVNNRRHARALYDAMVDEAGAYHLTTAMCAEHRSKKLEEIKKELKAGRPCRLVATSLIEAGVDVDFPVVYRAESGLDSIAQAAGRCNREGLRTKEESPVFVFSSSQWKAPPELGQQATQMNSILRHYKDDALVPKAIKDYFQHVYSNEGTDLDKYKILTKVKDTKDGDFPFQNIANDFRIINTNMLPIIVPFDKTAIENLDKLRYLPEDKGVGGIAQKLQRYVVQVPERAFVRLLKVGAVEAINPERFGAQFYTLSSMDAWYSDVAGLDWNDPEFIEASKSVF